MKERLDKRRCLYGEPRLSDAQVIALRALARRRLLRNRIGYEADGAVIRNRTIEALENQWLAKRDDGGCCGAASITERGRKILRQIDEAAGGQK